MSQHHNPTIPRANRSSQLLHVKHDITALTATISGEGMGVESGGGGGSGETVTSCKKLRVIQTNRKMGVILLSYTGFHEKWRLGRVTWPFRTGTRQTRNMQAKNNSGLIHIMARMSKANEARVSRLRTVLHSADAGRDLTCGRPKKAKRENKIRVWIPVQKKKKIKGQCWPLKKSQLNGPFV